MKSADFDKMAEGLRNWGRWGPEDQRGTLNHIDPAALQRAAGEVKQGKMFALGLNFDENGPQFGGFRFNPMKYMTAMNQKHSEEFPRSRFNDDVIHMPLQCATQWDALSHVHYDDHFYNGFSIHEHLSLAGATRCGVENMAKPGVASRGVLLDITKLVGVDILPGDFEIKPDHLNQACEAQGVTVEKGDIVVVRTGQIGKFTRGSREEFYNGQPGCHHTCAEWLYEKNAAAIAADNVAVEGINAETYGDEMMLPMHQLCLRDMGMPFGEMFDLDALAADCAADGQYTFMLVAPPLAITRAVGSPINPIAMK